MSTNGWIRACAVFSLLICVQMFFTNLNYLLHGTSQDALSLGAAWVVMVWCAALLVTGASLLLLIPWARMWVICLLCVYAAYYLIPFGWIAISSMAPIVLLLGLIPAAVPLLCVWYLSRPVAREALAAGVRLTSAST